MAGLKIGSREWVMAMKSHYVHDSDVIVLCTLLLNAWDDLEAIPQVAKEENNGPKESAESAVEDEWNS